MTHTELINDLKRRGPQNAIAAVLGVSATYLSDIINQRCAPGKKLLDALGLERVVTYQPKRKRRA